MGKCKWCNAPLQLACEFDIPISGNGYCILHDPSPDKDNDKFIEEIKRLSDKAKQLKEELNLKGAVFPGDFKDFYLLADHDALVELSGALFLGVANFENLNFKGGINLQNAEFQRESIFNNITITKQCSFSSTSFKGAAAFKEAKINLEDGHSGLNLKGVTFERDADFNKAEFTVRKGGLIDFTSTEFKGKAKFRGAKFYGDLSFSKVEFSQYSDFKHVTFKERTNFAMSNFYKNVSFDYSAFHDGAIFNEVICAGICNFYLCVFEKHFLFENAKISYAKVGECEFLDTVSFKFTQFVDKANLKDNKFLQGCKFEGAKFGPPTEEQKKKMNRLTFINQVEGESNFKKCEFRLDAFFIGSKFEQADFNNAHFFRTAKFCDSLFEKALFMSTHFESTVTFAEAVFGKGGACFDPIDKLGPTKFKEGCSFGQTEFKGPVSFREVEFNCEGPEENIAFFKETKFNKEVDFQKTKFHNGAAFENAIFSDVVRFQYVKFPTNAVPPKRVEPEEKKGKQKYWVDFTGTIFYNPERVFFNHVSFERCRFLSASPSFFRGDFMNVTWGEKCRTILKKWKYFIRPAFFEETDAQRENTQTITKSIYAACQKLKMSQAKAGNYYLAGKFHIGEMDTRKRLAWREKNFLEYIVLGIYSILCRYGERWFRAFLWLIILIFLSAAGLMLIATFQPSKGFFPDFFSRAIPYMLSIKSFIGNKAAFKISRFTNDTLGFYYLFFTRIFIITQIYFFIISIRRYFHR